MRMKNCDRDRKASVFVTILLIVLMFLNFPHLYAENTSTSVQVLNSAPSVDVQLIPDDDPLVPGVQVINPDPWTTNKTVTVIAHVIDMNGHNDISEIRANITGVENNPITMSLCDVVNVTTVIYKGYFNMSNHSEGDYNVEVKATDFGGLTGIGSKNFSYSYGTPTEVVTTYDFTTGAGFDKWAFRKQYFEKPPVTYNVPKIEFNRIQYNKIKKREGSMQSDLTFQRDYFAIHRFLFKIAEPSSDITKIEVLWVGRGYSGINGATLYIWDFNAGKYEQLDSSNRTSMQLKGEIAKNVSDYISENGNLSIIAEQNYNWWWFIPCSILETDYVGVNVTWTHQHREAGGNK